MHLVPQLMQKPRRLQLKATRCPARQLSREEKRGSEKGSEPFSLDVDLMVKQKNAE
jgi:hypothetical protein